MRSTQYIGLHDRAIAWLEEHARKEHMALIRYRSGLHGCSAELVSSGESFITSGSDFQVTGMCEEKVPMHSFQLNDGDWVHEYVQADPWSSGPCIFTCLAWPNGQMIDATMWHPSEIEEQL